MPALTSRSPPCARHVVFQMFSGVGNWVTLASRPEVTTEPQSRWLAVKACSWSLVREHLCPRRVPAEDELPIAPQRHSDVRATLRCGGAELLHAP